MDFYLMIDPPEIFQFPVRQIPGKVPRSIQSRAAITPKLILNKALRVQLRTIQISPSHPLTSHINCPGCADWHATLLQIEQINLQIRDRLTNDAAQVRVEVFR